MRWFGVELENFQFLLVRVEADVSEQRRREVTLARVRQHGEDSVARLGALAHLRLTRESAAGGDVDEDSFLLRQRAAPFHRVGAGNGDNAADHAGVDGVCCELRDESGLQPCIGVGLNTGLGLPGEPSGLRSCCEPEETIGASIFKLDIQNTTISIEYRFLHHLR